VRITQKDDKYRLIQAVCIDNEEKGSVVHGVITSFTRKGAGLTVWVCKQHDEGGGIPSYTLLKTSSNHRWTMQLPTWSVVYKYDAKWNGKYDKPKVEGKLRKTDVTAATQAAADFDWDEFQHDVDSKSDSNTHRDSDDGLD
jgi:hypothetical protein